MSNSNNSPTPPSRNTGGYQTPRPSAAGSAPQSPAAPKTPEQHYTGASSSWEPYPTTPRPAPMLKTPRTPEQHYTGASSSNGPAPAAISELPAPTTPPTVQQKLRARKQDELIRPSVTEAVLRAAGLTLGHLAYAELLGKFFSPERQTSREAPPAPRKELNGDSTLLFPLSPGDNQVDGVPVPEWPPHDGMLPGFMPGGFMPAGFMPGLDAAHFAAHFAALWPLPAPVDVTAAAGAATALERENTSAGDTAAVGAATSSERENPSAGDTAAVGAATSSERENPSAGDTAAASSSDEDNDYTGSTCAPAAKRRPRNRQ